MIGGVSRDLITVGRRDRHAGRRPLARAICRFRFRFGRIADSGCLHIPHGQRLTESDRAGPRSFPDLLLGTMVDGSTALLIIVAMAFGLIVPKLAIEYFFPRLADAEPPANDD
jgi:hypothetical protein